MKLSNLLLLILTLLPLGSMVAKENYLDSYNLNRAYEEGEKGNYTDAIEYFKKEIKEHPRNSLAYLGIGGIYYDQKKYDEAYKAVNDAIETAPKKDKHLLSTAYYYKGTILLATSDTVSALQNFEKAMSLDPKFADVFEKRGQLYYEQKKYDLSNADYAKLIELKPAYEMGYMGLGRNYNTQKNYDEALNQYNKVLEMYPEYSSGYSFRGETYLNQKEYLRAIDDICKALSIDSDRRAYLLLFEFPEDQEALVAAKLKGIAAENPHTGEYLYYLGQVHNHNKHYEKSNEILEKALEIDTYPVILSLISENHQSMGDYKKALSYKEQEIQIKPDDETLLAEKGDLLGDVGDYEGAIDAFSQYIDKTPDYFGGYYRRGWFKDLSMKTDEAIEDYIMAITLNPDYAYAHFGLGDMYARKGETEKAKDEYEKVLALDTVPTDNSCAMYAYLALGRKDEAIDFMNKVIEADTLDAGNYYDAACIYGRIGDKQKSLQNLKLALEKGFRRFPHIDNDDDMDPIRNLPEFQEIMNQYRPTNNNLNTKEESTRNEEEFENIDFKIVEIPFTPDGGCASVKCTINDLPLTFIFDTGASVVSMSQLEANFMLKNGYLNQSDFVGNGRFVNADGEVSENSIINLKNIDFGGLHLTNVKASVVKNQKAPLLLGQTVLGRLGSIEIDNTNKKLIIRK